jgi:hypothetical protein
MTHPDTPPRIAVIGAGNVGAALGGRFVESGYEVAYGVRNPGAGERARERVNAGAGIRPIAEAVEQADVIFLAVPGSAAVDAALSLGAIAGKILVDCNNPVGWDAGPVWSPPEQGSITEAIAARVAGARVVKGFNTFGAEFHADPTVQGDPIDVQLASDDADAKAVVAAIATKAGFNPIDVGPLRNARLLENLAILWIHLAIVEKRGRDVVFTLRPRTAP